MEIALSAQRTVIRRAVVHRIGTDDYRVFLGPLYRTNGDVKDHGLWCGDTDAEGLRELLTKIATGRSGRLNDWMLLTADRSDPDSLMLVVSTHRPLSETSANELYAGSLPRDVWVYFAELNLYLLKEGSIPSGSAVATCDECSIPILESEIVYTDHGRNVCSECRYYLHFLRNLSKRG